MNVSLLEYLTLRMGCGCISDLRTLSSVQRQDFVRHIQSMHVSDASVSEWNDALLYLTDEPSRKTAGEARDALMRAMSW